MEKENDNGLVEASMEAASGIRCFAMEQKIIQGDCLEVMRGFADKQFDLVLTDPPYGIGMDGGNIGYKGYNDFEKKDWDKTTPRPEYFTEMQRISKYQVIFGGNYFQLPPSRGFFVWDKGEGFRGRTYAECELAYVSKDTNAKIFKYDPLARGDYRGKHHPTQKPIELMRWCISQFPEVRTIIDPFMGSGSTLVAAKELGIQAVGIEIDKEYLEIARKRLEQESLF